MHHDHLAIFTVLSIVVAVFGSWTALDLFRRVRGHAGDDRLVWLSIAALAMGSSIWSMHFIAMLGFDPGSPVSYDLPLTALSLVLAVGGTGIAFFIAVGGEASVHRLAAAGATMGLSICAMHYVGMAAVRTAVAFGYEPALVAASFAVALGASTAALLAASKDRSAEWRAGAALGLGLAIVGMHYLAMAALRLTLLPSAGELIPGAPPVVLAVAVAAGTILILILALGAALYDQRSSMLAALDAGGAGYWELRLPGRELIASPGAKALLGVPPDQPVTQADVEAQLDPESRATRSRALEAALRGEADFDVEYGLKTGRWLQVRGRVFRGRSGHPVKLAGVIIDVTERRETFAALATSNRRQQLLMNELNHRVKNTLATVQAIASATARQTASVDDFVERFEARLMALSKTHNVLTATGWEGADLSELLAQELAPYPVHQVAVEGPSVRLGSEESLALGMVFHELTTNAAKHGALSSPEGRVEVKWIRRQDDRMTLTWIERGGPSVALPTRTGFGSRLIKTTLEGGLKGSGHFDFEPEGLAARLEFQLRAIAPSRM